MAYSEKEIDSKFNSIIESICGGKSLRDSLCIYEVSQTSFYKWLDLDKEKKIQYTRAREERADKIFEDILKIADESENDIITNPDGTNRVNSEVVQRSKIRIDARKWMLGKMDSKKYGDKNTTTLEGGGKPLEVKQTIISLGNGKRPDETTT